MSNLKPCPFCGKEPNQKGTELGDRPCFYYECENPKCGASEMGWHGTEQEAIDAWNNRPIEDALRKEIAQLKKYKLELNAQCFHKDETILVLKNRITELQADNISLVEQVNQMALKPNQEIIEWHKHPLYPDTSRCCIVECTDNCFYIAHHSDIDGWLHSITYEQLLNVKSWAYLPKGANHEQEVQTQKSRKKSTDNDTCGDSAGDNIGVSD